MGEGVTSVVRLCKTTKDAIKDSTTRDGGKEIRKQPFGIRRLRKLGRNAIIEGRGG